MCEGVTRGQPRPIDLKSSFILSYQNKYQRRHDANFFVTGCTACYDIPGRQRHRVGIMATQFFCEGFYLRFFPCLRFRCPWPCRKWRFEVGSSSCHLTGPSDLQHHSLCSDAPPSFLCGMEMDKMKCFLPNLATLGLSMGYENWPHWLHHFCEWFGRVAFCRNALWTNVTDGYIQRFSKATDSPLCTILTTGIYCPPLTLKRLGHFFQNVISFFDAVHLMCNSFIWNWSNTMNVKLALWILMAWCFSTRASVATVLTTHPCVSRCLRVKAVQGDWKALWFLTSCTNCS